MVMSFTTSWQLWSRILQNLRNLRPVWSNFQLRRGTKCMRGFFLPLQNIGFCWWNPSFRLKPHQPSVVVTATRLHRKHRHRGEWTAGDRPPWSVPPKSPIGQGSGCLPKSLLGVAVLRRTAMLKLHISANNVNHTSHLLKQSLGKWRLLLSSQPSLNNTTSKLALISRKLGRIAS